MKVLMLSGDKNVLIPNTDAFKRLSLQRSSVEKLDVYVWPQVHSAWEIISAAKQNNYDVVTVQDPFWRGMLAWRVARKSGAKFNVQVHSDLETQSFLRHILAQIVLRHADSIRIVSERIKTQVERMSIQAPIRVLPVYVDLEHFRSIIPQAHSQKTLLWIGRFEDEKDPRLAVNILKDIRSGGLDVKLVMLGEGTLLDILRQDVKDLPVEFPGWQDPAQYLAKSDAVLSTSPRESWGASIVEALAVGVPVVSMDVGVAKEAGAIVVPKRDLAKATTEVLRTGDKAVLKLSLLEREAWAKRWRETLI